MCPPEAKPLPRIIVTVEPSKAAQALMAIAEESDLTTWPEGFPEVFKARILKMHKCARRALRGVMQILETGDAAADGSD